MGGRVLHQLNFEWVLKEERESTLCVSYLIFRISIFVLKVVIILKVFNGLNVFKLLLLFIMYPKMCLKHIVFPNPTSFKSMIRMESHLIKLLLLFVDDDNIDNHSQSSYLFAPPLLKLLLRLRNTGWRVFNVLKKVCVCVCARPHLSAKSCNVITNRYWESHINWLFQFALANNGLFLQK